MADCTALSTLIVPIPDPHITSKSAALPSVPNRAVPGPVPVAPRTIGISINPPLPDYLTRETKKHTHQTPDDIQHLDPSEIQARLRICVGGGETGDIAVFLAWE